MLGVLFSLGFVSCSDDDDPETHTDASVLVGGTFTGSICDSKGVEKATDVKLVSASLKMETEDIFNVAKAGNDRYTFGSGSASAPKNTGGVIEGNKVTVYASLNSKYKFNSASAGKLYTINAVKVSE